MSQNKSNLSYDSLSLKLFRALVRLQNKFSKWRRNKTIARWNCRSKEANLEVFDRFKALIPEIAGYNQEETFKQLQIRAYKRKARSFLDYYETVVKDKDELSFLRENLTYTGSHFFRGDNWARVADLCREKIANSNQDKFHIWRAACANGKEVYSILMTALDVAQVSSVVKRRRLARTVGSGGGRRPRVDWTNAYRRHVRLSKTHLKISHLP